MQRFMNNYGGGATSHGPEGNDSVVSSDFNWNEISIGNGTISESNFFGRNHPEHERDGKRQNAKIVFEKSDFDEDTVNENDHDGMASCKVMMKKNSVESDDSNLSASFDDKLKVNQTPTPPTTPPPPPPPPPPKQKQQQKNHHNQNERKPLTQYNSKVPNVYIQGQLYKQRQELRMQAIVAKEREQRRFRSHDAPNFEAIHAARNQKRVHEEPKITIPVTPQVVRSHRHYSKLAKDKQTKLMESMKPKPFVSKEAEVLKQAPFVPHLKKKTPTEPAPFNLQSDERLKERREYDQKIEMEAKRKQKEEEERRKVAEENIRRQIRQQTAFKANPNPFSVGK